MRTPWQNNYIKLWESENGLHAYGTMDIEGGKKVVITEIGLVKQMLKDLERLNTEREKLIKQMEIWKKESA